MVSGELLLDRSFVKGEYVGVIWEIREMVEGDNFGIGSEWVERGVEKMLMGWVRSLRIRLGFLCLNF